jgi:hypothetical protein
MKWFGAGIMVCWLVLYSCHIGRKERKATKRKPWEIEGEVIEGELIEDEVIEGEVIEDELWERIEPLLPVTRRRFRHPGRNRGFRFGVTLRWL